MKKTILCLGAVLCISISEAMIHDSTCVHIPQMQKSEQLKTYVANFRCACYNTTIKASSRFTPMGLDGHLETRTITKNDATIASNTLIVSYWSNKSMTSKDSRYPITPDNDTWSCFFPAIHLNSSFWLSEPNTDNNDILLKFKDPLHLFRGVLITVNALNQSWPSYGNAKITCLLKNAAGDGTEHTFRINSHGHCEPKPTILGWEPHFHPKNCHSCSVKISSETLRNQINDKFDITSLAVIPLTDNPNSVVSRQENVGD